MPSDLATKNEAIYDFKAMSGQIAVDEAKGVVECFVAGIGNKDSVGDIVLPGAFTESLKRRKPRVVWGHDWNHPIGKVLEIYEVPASDLRLPAKMKQAGIGGLFAKVQFNLMSEKGREAFANVVFYGMDQEWSIGYKTLDAIFDNQRQANLLREVELYEVSPVLHGANQLTGTISIKADKPEDEVDSFGKSKWKMFDREFAARIKEDYPEIWAAGGNIKGNDQYEILTRIAQQGGKAKTPDQVAALKLREAWVARHAQDFRLPGVIAQIKWLAVGSRGESYMKNVVNEAIQKKKERSKTRKKGMGMEYEPMKMPKPNLGEDSSLSPESTQLGLTQALGKRFGGLIKIFQVMPDKVMFSVPDEQDMTKRYAVNYYKQGSDFLFGEIQKVKPVMNWEPVEDGDEEEMDPSSMMAKLAEMMNGMDDDTEESMSEEMGFDDEIEDEEKGCGCGCGSKRRRSAPPTMMGQIFDVMKSLNDAEVKAGRVISAGNLEKIQQAISLLQEVAASGGQTQIEMKQDSDVYIQANIDDLFDLKQHLDPVLEFHNIDSLVDEGGIHLYLPSEISTKSLHFDPLSAVQNAVNSFLDAW